MTNGPTWVSGILSNALSLDGTNDWVKVTNNGTLDPSLKSVSFWINFQSTAAGNGNQRALLGNSPGANSTGSGFLVASMSNRKFRFQAYDGSGNGRVKYSEAMATGVWHAVALVLDGSNLVGYVNGSSVGSVGCVGYSNTTASLWRLGWNLGGFSNAHAVLDDVRIYPCALTATDVKDLHFSDSDSDGWEDRREINLERLTKPC